jgi:hypothetical protein
MWSVSRDCGGVLFVWQVKRDRPAGEQHERERGLRAVEAVGAAGDQTDLVVERFGAALVDAQADRGEDPVAVLAQCLAVADERLEPAAGQAGQEPVDQDFDVLDVEAGLKDAAGGFFELVSAPDLAAGGSDPGERGGLLVGELLGLLEQRPAGVFEAPGGLLVAGGAQLVSVSPADLVQRLVGELNHVIG